MSCAVTSPEIELPLCLTVQNSPRYIASASSLHLPLPLARTSYISPWQASCCRPFSNTPSHPVLFSIIQDRVEKPCPRWFQIGPFSTVTATNKPKIQTHNDIRLIGSRWSLNLSQAPDILRSEFRMLWFSLCSQSHSLPVSVFPPKVLHQCWQCFWWVSSADPGLGGVYGYSTLIALLTSPDLTYSSSSPALTHKTRNKSH